VTADPLAGFDRYAFRHDGLTRDVYRAGSGPAVVVIHEMPGLHPDVATFARKVVDSGCTVYMPSLFGTPGRPVSGRYLLRTVLRVCVAREFTAFATGKTSPVAGWLRGLASRAHAECGGPGVGAVGMCFTGGFALAMLVEAPTLAAVLSQPSIPAGSARRSADLGLYPKDLEQLKQRVAGDGACAMGLRFSGDKLSPAVRFETLRRELGDAFVAVEIDSSPGNPHGIDPKAHSVLTVDLVDQPGHPTRQALDQVLAFLRERLAVTTPG
jgi:dienelactone hydrolase